jgi:hypothetical protein
MTLCDMRPVRPDAANALVAVEARSRALIDRVIATLLTFE